MARTIPATPVTLPNPEGFAPTKQIHSGVGLSGGFQDLAQNINLACSTGHCGPVVQQCWSDSQFSTAVGSAYLPQCRWRIPTISYDHVTLNCSVYASSSTKVGEVTFIGGTTSTIVIGSAAFKWFDTTISVNTTNDLEDVFLYTEGAVDIITVKLSYEGLGTGSWPAADGALPSGVLTLWPLEEDYIPLDDDEFDDDKPLSSDLGQYMADNVSLLDTRHKVHFSFAGMESLSKPMEPYPHRVMVPVKKGGTSVDVHVYATPSASTTTELYIKHGAGSSNGLSGFSTANSNVSTLSIPSGGSPGWYSTTITLIDDRTAEAPSRYPGFTRLEFLPEIVSGVAIHDIWSITVVGE